MDDAGARFGGESARMNYAWGAGDMKMLVTFVTSTILQCDTEANHFRIKRQILFGSEASFFSFN